MKKNAEKIELIMMSAWGFALIAVLGSLYFSEIRNYVPCELCWIQRIFMYPLAITLAIATVKKDSKQAFYTLPLSVIGTAFSLYHYLIQKVPLFAESGEACGVIPCNYQYINYFGFITIPFLAFIAFFSISILMIWVIKLAKE
ncbi:disulfide oxidoreductase [Salipaludibacillus sp. CF4.18]|uniref:disulfide oxidoreductase n=1 Tax=Salipaludibacillus sp. CF4.18 TaxID=3373081 RepID=UPI003EE57BCA